jgi:hypothetical protein
MPDSLPPEQVTEDAAQRSEPTMHARYVACAICGQSYDHVDPILAAYHSIEMHGPTSD